MKKGLIDVTDARLMLTPKWNFFKEERLRNAIYVNLKWKYLKATIAAQILQEWETIDCKDQNLAMDHMTSKLPLHILSGISKGITLCFALISQAPLMFQGY